MSSKPQREQQADGEETLWTVRDPDGTTFGPASIATLQAWARDGRLAPNHMTSCDGHNWQPVTSLPELEMDRVVEVATGTFYGPVHRQALAGLIQEGALAAGSSLFRRDCPVAKPQTPAREAADEAARIKRWEAQQARQAEQIADLERQLHQVNSDNERLRGELSHKDLEFEAERQELRAMATRQQADLAKLEIENRIQAKQLEHHCGQERLLQESRSEVAALEERLAQAAEQQAAATATLQQELTAAQHERDDAALALHTERAAQAGQAAAIQQLNETVEQLRLQQTSLRKLLRQATNLLDNETGSSHEAARVEVVTVGDEEALPPRAPLSLNQLEAQAQREIQRLGRQPGTVFNKRR